jgi:mono/diheme cytochrome c family protein
MRALVLISLFLSWPGFAHAADPVLEIAVGGETRSFTRDELLARPDATTVDVGKDATYGKPMSYRAVPVAALLKGLSVPADGAIETIATDGFTAQIPASLMLNSDSAQPMAWVAIEPADKPWPKIGGNKDYTAGPFYIVWTGPEVRSEYWAYQTAKLVSQPTPLKRWPQLAVDPALPANDPLRKGEALYLAQCLPCHKLNGGGAANVGPDLNLPMNPTEYMTPKGLHALIRDPKSVRDWPGRKMNGWSPDLLSDAEIDLIIAYLGHMAGRKKAPEP